MSKILFAFGLMIAGAAVFTFPGFVLGMNSAYKEEMRKTPQNHRFVELLKKEMNKRLFLHFLFVLLCAAALCAPKILGF